MTQGVLSVVQGGKVRLKIIAGNDGDKVIEVAKQIKRLNRVPTLEEAYKMAQDRELGSSGNLVVMNEGEARFDGDSDLDDRYRETFDQPEFNPRWELGTADHVVVVNLDS